MFFKLLLLFVCPENQANCYIAQRSYHFLLLTTSAQKDVKSKGCCHVRSTSVLSPIPESSGASSTPFLCDLGKKGVPGLSLNNDESVFCWDLFVLLPRCTPSTVLQAVGLFLQHSLHLLWWTLSRAINYKAFIWWAFGKTAGVSQTFSIIEKVTSSFLLSTEGEDENKDTAAGGEGQEVSQWQWLLWGAR